MDHRLRILQREMVNGDEGAKDRYIAELERIAGIKSADPENPLDLLPDAKPLDESEDSEVFDAWFKAAHAMQTDDSVDEFIQKLSEYQHDYGTIVQAMAAAALAAVYKLNAHPREGGITGFQAGCMMWVFTRRWLSRKSSPLRLLDYGNMLYPQYAHHFKSTISPDVWEWLQKEAANKLKEGVLSDTVRAHIEKIAAGEVPFGYEIKDDG